MINFLFAAIPSLFFFITKMAFSGIRFSDTNVYFYTAIELLKGKLLYKDIFFTNLPLFPYISSFYAFIIGKKLELYYVTAGIEVVATGLFIYFISLKKTNNRIYALISQSLYLFSFIVLSTSDYQTGVFIASFFSVAAYYFYEIKGDILTGIFFGLMILSKAYYLPIFIAFSLYFLIKDKKRCLKIGMGFLGICFVVITPFIIMAGKQFFQDIILYSLFRSQGVEKLKMISFFVTHDILLVGIVFWVFLKSKKHVLYFLIFFLSGLLILFYKDVYYLYLNLFIPFIVISFAELIKEYEEQLGKYKYIVFVIIIVALTVNFSIYLKQYSSLQRIYNMSEIISLIKREKPQYLYGAMEITPAFSYLSGVPLLENIIDTNDNIFYKGVLDAKLLTSKALSKKTIVITKGMDYPADNIHQPIAGGSVDEKKIIDQCKNHYAYPITTEGLINTITLFRCY